MMATMSAPTRPAPGTPVVCPVCGELCSSVETNTEKWEQYEGGGIGPEGQGPPLQPRRSVPGPSTTTFRPCGCSLA